ncbi:MAG: hypothetical protein ABSA33_04740, partial [Candidatus Micrarchaeaceae archaeon]
IWVQELGRGRTLGTRGAGPTGVWLHGTCLRWERGRTTSPQAVLAKIDTDPHSIKPKGVLWTVNLVGSTTAEDTPSLRRHGRQTLGESSQP